MRSSRAGIAFAVVMLFFGLRGQAQNPNNPLDVALLRWYGGDASALFTADIGPFPDTLAFDGASMWLANEGTNTVTKLRASDGACVGTCVFTVGNGPCGLAFDGANMWVPNGQDSTLTKLRASDGYPLVTVTLSGLGCGIAFDGSHIWVANTFSGTISELSPSGSILGTCTASPASAPYVTALAFDGTYIWATNPLESAVPGYVTRLQLQPSGVGCAGASSVKVGIAPNWLAFDGTNVWVSNSYDGTVTKLLASAGTVTGTYSVGGPSVNAGGVAFDGKYIWVANQTPSTVTKLQASTGAIVGVFQLGPSTNTPFGVAFDGANIWVEYGQGSHLPAAGVYKL